MVVKLDAIKSPGRPNLILGISLFIAALGAYVLTDAGGYLLSIDVQESIAVANSLVSHGHVSIVGFPPIPGGGSVIGTGGLQYSPHAIGLALLFVPIATVLHFSSFSPGFTAFLYSLINPIFGALLVTTTYVVALRLTKNRTAGLATAATLGLCTLIWPYTSNGFDVLPTSFFLLVGASSLWTAERSTSPKWYWFSSAAFGCALLLRADAAIAIMLGSVWVVYLLVVKAPARLHRIVAWALPILLSTVLTCWYNWARFGSIINDGHRNDPNTLTTTPLWYGFLSQLISPGKGLLFFALPLLVALFGWKVFFRTARGFCIFSIALPLATALFEARYQNWSGAEAWGPRFLVPSIVFLLLPLAFVFDGWNRFPRALRIAFGTVIFAGFVVAFSGASLSEIAVDRVHSGTEQVQAWRTSQILWTFSGLSQSLRGNDPYPSTAEGGVAPAPIPLFDYWWARTDTRNPTAIGVTVGILMATTIGASAYCVYLSWPTRRKRHPDVPASVPTTTAP
jgi:hypothetical protein